MVVSPFLYISTKYSYHKAGVTEVKVLNKFTGEWYPEIEGANKPVPQIHLEMAT